MLAVTGRRSTIVAELAKLLPPDEELTRIPMDTSLLDAPLKVPKADRFVLAAGILPGRSMLQYTLEDAQQVTAANLVNPIRICEWVLNINPTARICVIGSDSARHGSFDKLYAATKAGLHAYVMTRSIRPTQQLVVVAPPIIRDSGMTERRADYPAVLEQRVTCSAAQVAQLVHRLLYRPDFLYLNNLVHRVLGDACAP